MSRGTIGDIGIDKVIAGFVRYPLHKELGRRTELPVPVPGGKPGNLNPGIPAKHKGISVMFLYFRGVATIVILVYLDNKFSPQDVTGHIRGRSGDYGNLFVNGFIKGKGNCTLVTKHLDIFRPAYTQQVEEAETGDPFLHVLSQWGSGDRGTGGSSRTHRSVLEF